ncbi:chemotaxis protein CheW, partial [Pseudomonas palleroniana]
GKFVIVLEVDRVLSIDEMSLLAEASPSALEVDAP